MRNNITYPVMVYKNGQKGDYQICNNSKEVVLAAEDNYWPLFMASKDDVMNEPRIKAELNAEVNAKEEAEAKDDIVKEAIKKKRNAKKTREG